MRFDTDFNFWVVVDPSRVSDMGDVLFRASLRDLELQIRGGLRAEHNPTLFTDREEAEAEARARLVAARASRTILEHAAEGAMAQATHLTLRDGKGRVVLKADLGD